MGTDKKLTLESLSILQSPFKMLNNMLSNRHSLTINYNNKLFEEKT